MSNKPETLFEGNVVDNYIKYLKEPLMIGFTKRFPVKEILDEISVNTTCREFPVEFKVKLVRVSFGENNEYAVSAIVTDRVKISDRLFMGGWNSYCHVDEANVMEAAVVKMCQKHDLMVCEKVCSWPFAKAIVQPNHFKN